MDALNLAGPVSLELIHLAEPRERAYWAHVLSISQAELEQIVDRVGPRAIDVRHHLARTRHAEWQRLAHQSHHRVAPSARASAGGPVFGLIVGCAAAVATTFGALAYGLMPLDEWTVFQREHGCEAVANSDPAIKQVACPDGRTIAQTKLAGAVDSTEPKLVRRMRATSVDAIAQNGSQFGKYLPRREPADDAKSEP